MTVIERLRQKAASLPATPGVYIMKNQAGDIIYVGKSKKLKNRVSSYFTGTGHSYKTARMVSLVRDFDFFLCDTEIEALALENVLIKKHSPKYNIKLKDAKSYPYIKVTAEEYPRLLVTRERKSDRGRYYGPYRGTSDAYAARDAVMRIFRLVGCKRAFPDSIGKERPCLYKDMGRCIAPCSGEISPDVYRALVRGAESVLSGNIKQTRAVLQEEMEQAAENMEFERAAALRDSIRALEGLREKQKVVADERVERDVFALYTAEPVGVLAMLSVRGGALVNKNEFILSSAEPLSNDDATSLIADYYDTAGNIPREIMLDFLPDEEQLQLLSEYLSLLAARKVAVRVPERGEGRALCDMALENAKETAHQHLLEGERENKNLKRLTELLGLASVPQRIEAYDISNWGNECISASMVVLENGKLKKSDYRAFNLRNMDRADDYAAMRQVLERRLKHVGDGTPSLGTAPDLILLDGGANHVNTVAPVCRKLLPDIRIYGMVKDDYHKTRAITDGEREISIATEMGVYAFIYSIQEEVHRFALKQSSGSKHRTLTHSTLERIEGIGPVKSKRLLAAMPLSRIKVATEEELRAVKGVSDIDARRVFEYFHKPRGKGKF